jgi:hypothetical protein
MLWRDLFGWRRPDVAGAKRFEAAPAATEHGSSITVSPSRLSW